MAPMAQKRRRGEDDIRKPKKKIHVKRQKHYHSSSEDEDEEQPVVSDAPVRRAVEGKQAPKSILKQARNTSPSPENGAHSLSEDEDGEDEEGGADLDETEMNTALNAAPMAEESDADEDEDQEYDDEGAIAQDAPSTEESDLDDSDSDPESSTTKPRQKKKRNDPTAFATSISKILDTKLTTAKRADPVLARSTTAHAANQTLSDQKLEHAARAQLRTEKRAALEKGRVRDVLGLESADVSTGAVQEEERRLKKVAQRGVVRLFNAVRAAQVRAEKGEEVVRGEGVVGVEQRRERVEGMSKEGFLELISRGGGEKAKAAAV